MKAKSADRVTHCLPLTQPWAWAVVDGQLECANLYLPPRPELIGKRIAILATQVAAPDLWMLPEYQKVEFPKDWYRVGWKEGVIGTVELQGWMHVGHDRKVLKVKRATKSTKHFRKPRGQSCGCMVWVLRKGNPLPVNHKLKVIRAQYRDRPDVQQHLLDYVDKYGPKNLGSQYLEEYARLRARGKKR